MITVTIVLVRYGAIFDEWQAIVVSFNDTHDDDQEEHTSNRSAYAK